MKKVLTLILALVCLTLPLSGCGGDKKETPKDAVTNALNAVKNLDKENISKYFGTESVFNEGKEQKEDEDSEEYAKLFVEKLKFKILSTDIDGEKATVKTEITNIDAMKALQKYLQEAFTEALNNAFQQKELTDEEAEKKSEEKYIEILKSDDIGMTTNNVDIKLTRNGDSWKIDLDEELQNAILGGLIKAEKSMTEGSGE